jgi:hypothetical protein
MRSASAPCTTGRTAGPVATGVPGAFPGVLGEVDAMAGMAGVGLPLQAAEGDNPDSVSMK